MSLEQKLDELIPALGKMTDKITEAMALIQANGGGTGTAAAEDKPKTTRAKKDAPTTPTHDMAAVKAKFEDIKEKHPTAVPSLKKLIADAGCTNLAELLTKPDKFDAAYAALDTLETELTGAGATDADDDL